MNEDSHIPQIPQTPHELSAETLSGQLGFELARFDMLKAARERGLVLAAAGITHAIERIGNEWALRAANTDAERALAEIAAYEAEVQAGERPESSTGIFSIEPAEPSAAATVSTGSRSLPLVALAFVTAAVAQAECGSAWVDAGLLSAVKVVAQAQWWRVFTALTLHADMPHVVVNLVSILIFGGLLARSLGSGVAWLLIIVSGATGNLLTAWLYFPVDHRSIGASTAVFGALGLLVGDALGQMCLPGRQRSWWHWILPLGAGVSLLAYLGAGDGNTPVDVLAHVSGFVVGLPLGFGAGLIQTGRIFDGAPQTISALVTAGCLVVAWERALAASL